MARARGGWRAGSDVDTLGVETWIATMGARGAGTTTVLRAYGVLSGILADAVKGKRLSVNPCKGVENLPRRTGKRRVYLSAEDVTRLADESGQHRALVLTLAYCGLRWGEAIALRVGDVEFLRRRLSVSECRAARRRPCRRPHEGTQSALGTSTGIVLDALSVQCAGKGMGELVFGGSDGAYLPRPKSVGGWFVAAAKRAGVLHRRYSPQNVVKMWSRDAHSDQ